MGCPQINVLFNEGRPSIEVNDYELFDWLDDLFTEEFGSPPVSYDELEKQDFDKIRMNFASNVSLERLQKLVASLDRDEVERIYRLNNA